MKKKPTNMKILKETKGLGRHQKGEDEIASTYQNADIAVQAILSRLD